MNVIEPVIVTPDMMIYSNVAETDYPSWNGATSYAIGARVVRAHAIWESVQAANVGHDPSLDDGSWWIRVSATNRWRAFDGALAPSVVKADLIDYGIVLPVTTDSVALFGLNASEVQVNVIDPVDGGIYDQTVSLISSVDISDAWDYCFAPITYLSEYIFRDIPAWSGCTIRIRIRGGVNTSVSEIIVGQRRSIGQCLVETSIGIQDYSIKERDEWGSQIITVRPSSDVVAFKFAFPTEDARRLRDLFRRIRAVPAVYDAGDGTDMLGTTILGFYKDFSIPLTTTRSFGVLEVESLV